MSAPTTVPARRGDLVCVVSTSDVPSTTGPVITKTMVRLALVTNISRAGDVRGYREIDGTHVTRVGASTRGERYLLIPASVVDVDAAAAAYLARGSWFDRCWSSQSTRATARQQGVAAAIDDARQFIRPFRLDQSGEKSA